jgi:hypothetical protein
VEHYKVACIPPIFDIHNKKQSPLAFISTPFSIVHFSCSKSPPALDALRRVLECLPNAMITSPIDSVYAEA